MEKLLSVESLHFRYNSRVVLKDVNLDISPGELLWLSGDNGAGKTTLIRIIAGLIQNFSGRLHFSENPKQLTCYLPSENNGLYQKFSALENLQFWLQLRSVAPDQAQLHQILSQWGFDHPFLREQLPIEKFSTGMKRRLSLARLCSSQGRLWLLDEPFYGLDKKAVEHFAQELRQHLDQNGAAIVVSHEESLLNRLDHRKIHLQRRSL